MTLTPRFHRGLQGSYTPATYDGVNKSGVVPLGSKVLLLTDQFSPVTEGNVHIPDQIVERYTLGAESGVLIELGPDAFKGVSHSPMAGCRVYYEKFAGLLVRGNDGKEYRLMDDTCVGALFNLGEPD